MKLKYLIILIFAIGLFLVLYSLFMKSFNDDNAKKNLEIDAAKFIESRDLNKLNITDFKKNYYQKFDSLKTSKYKIFDLGSGLLIFSLTLLLFLNSIKYKNLDDLKNLKSLSRVNLIISSNIVAICMLPGTFWYYFLRQVRGDYPWFADSIGIPIFYTIPSLIFGIIILNIFLVISTKKLTLPCKIFVKSIENNFKFICIRLFFGLILMILIIFLVLIIIDGDHFSIPAILFYIYIVLSIRGGMITKINDELMEYEL